MAEARPDHGPGRSSLDPMAFFSRPLLPGPLYLHRPRDAEGNLAEGGPPRLLRRSPTRILMWATRDEFKLERWSMPIFLTDVVLVSASLYFSAGADTELYLMCFLIIYLVTLGRRVRDTIPMALDRLPALRAFSLPPASKRESPGAAAAPALPVLSRPGPFHVLSLRTNGLCKNSGSTA